LPAAALGPRNFERAAAHVDGANPVRAAMARLVRVFRDVDLPALTYDAGAARHEHTMERRQFLTSLGQASFCGAGVALGACATQVEARDEHADVAAKRVISPAQPSAAAQDSNASHGPPDMPASTFCNVSRDANLPEMPQVPTLLDFFRLRFFTLSDFSTNHLLQSAANARKHGQSEEIILACLLHDIGVLLMMPDHGYWGAQIVEPYVSEKVAWAIRYHQSLRFFADPEHGYEYPANYVKWFGKDFVPDAMTQRDYQVARAHRWYGESRAITLYDEYSFDDKVKVDSAEFTDIIGRHFRQPREGLGYDSSPTSHMWRSFMKPHKFL
jgi:hypothetical protein